MLPPSASRCPSSYIWQMEMASAAPAVAGSTRRCRNVGLGGSGPIACTSQLRYQRGVGSHRWGRGTPGAFSGRGRPSIGGLVCSFGIRARLRQGGDASLRLAAGASCGSMKLDGVKSK